MGNRDDTAEDQVEITFGVKVTFARAKLPEVSDMSEQDRDEVRALLIASAGIRMLPSGAEA